MEIIEWIKRLQECKIKVRKITPLTPNANTPTPKRQPPLAPNAKYNNTRYNNKGSDKEEIILGGTISIENPIFYHNHWQGNPWLYQSNILIKLILSKTFFKPFKINY